MVAWPGALQRRRPAGRSLTGQERTPSGMSANAISASAKGSVLQNDERFGQRVDVADET